MNKLLRAITTAAIGIGLLLLYTYLCVFSEVDKTEVLRQPSFFEAQNYWYVFLSAIGCLGFSLISCFLSWNKSLDTKVEILPNAISAEKEDVVSWVSGSSLDTKGKVAQQSARKDQTFQMQAKIRETETSIIRNDKSDKTITNQDDTQVNSAETILENTGTTETVLENSNVTVLETQDSTTICDTHTVHKDSGSENRLPLKGKRTLLIATICTVVICIVIGFVCFGADKKEDISNVPADIVDSQEPTAATFATESTVSAETESNKHTVEIEVSDGIYSVTAENLWIQVENERNVTVTLAGLTFQDSYVINKSTTEMYYTEYSWDVYMNGEEQFWITTHSFCLNPGFEEEVKLGDMSHSLFVLKEDNEGSYYSSICDASMSHTDDSITWRFSVPQEYEFDFLKMTQFVSGVSDYTLDSHATQVYDVVSSDRQP